MSLPVAGVGGCTELSASPPSQESLRRLPWCTCVSASARQSRAQCCATEFRCKILISHQSARDARRATLLSAPSKGLDATLTPASSSQKHRRNAATMSSARSSLASLPSVGSSDRIVTFAVGALALLFVRRRPPRRHTLPSRSPSPLQLRLSILPPRRGAGDAHPREEGGPAEESFAGR